RSTSRRREVAERSSLSVQRGCHRRGQRPLARDLRARSGRADRGRPPRLDVGPHGVRPDVLGARGPAPARARRAAPRRRRARSRAARLRRDAARHPWLSGPRVLSPTGLRADRRPPRLARRITPLLLPKGPPSVDDAPARRASLWTRPAWTTRIP